MFFGTRVDEATSMRLLDRYIEAGGNFLDTANIYAFWVEGGQGGESEALLGRWIAGAVTVTECSSPRRSAPRLARTSRTLR
jgi:aryl-alcohol dehydrogenase-like predicted oxidoreductase